MRVLIHHTQLETLSQRINDLHDLCKCTDIHLEHRYENNFHEKWMLSILQQINYQLV
jgi:hypothetical protein